MEKNKKIQKRKDCIISIYKVLQTLNKNKGKESVINVYFYTLIVQAKMEKLKKNFLELREKMLEKFDVKVNVQGGGVSGQADAVRHGISRALIQADENFRAVLKKAGFLTRDPRMKERKKPGQPGARRRFQFSKR